MSPTCDSLERLSLGAYVLGSLDPVERAQVEAHLGDCAACRDELSQLAGLPGLLARVSIEDVLDPQPSPPKGMVERLIARHRAARRMRRRRLAFAATAAAIVAVGVTVTVLGNQNTGEPSPQVRVAAVSATNHRTGVAARLEMRPMAWGTAIRVRLRGVPPGTRCRLIVGSRRGGTDVAGSWRADYDGTADVQSATAIPRSDLKSLEITTIAGRRLVKTSLE
jgi:predicted anti-sigma-YlaC factor YlaD